MYGLLEQRRALLAPRAAIPREEQLSWQPLIRGLDLELEAHGALAERRKAGHYADHLQVAALELGREPVRHAQVRCARRPQESDDKGEKRSEPRLKIAASNTKRQRE